MRLDSFKSKTPVMELVKPHKTFKRDRYGKSSIPRGKIKSGKTSKVLSETISSEQKRSPRTERSEKCLTKVEAEFYSNGNRIPTGYFLRSLLGKGGAAVVWMAESFTEDLTCAAK